MNKLLLSFLLLLPCGLKAQFTTTNVTSTAGTTHTITYTKDFVQVGDDNSSTSPDNVATSPYSRFYIRASPTTATTTAPPSEFAIKAVSGNDSRWTAIQLSRLSRDLDIAVAGGVNHFAQKSYAGDVVFRVSTPTRNTVTPNIGGSGTAYQPYFRGRMLFNLGINYTAMSVTGNADAATEPEWRIGIGTADPEHTLDIRSKNLDENRMQVNIFNEDVTEAAAPAKGNMAGIRFKTTSGMDVMLRTNKQTNSSLELADATGTWLHQWRGNDYFARGAVGINVSSIPAGYNFAVGGKIIAKELKVTATTIPDYVFSPAYRLRPLGEVATFIQQNGHLPEVPSAVEVAREGINVSEMQATLLKKVEELTLYMIEQNKKLQNQQQQIEQLQVENQQLRGRKRKQ